MKRRDFIKASATAATAAVAGVTTLSQFSNCTSKEVQVKTQLQVEGYVREPAKKIPVIASSDVVVVGGGPAGVSAAVSAARQGVSVILLERYNHLGGLWTGGLVLATNCTHGLSSSSKYEKALCGFTADVLTELDELGLLYGDSNQIIDPESCKYVLEKFIREAGVKVIYHSFASEIIGSDEKIDGVLIESKSGRCCIKCKMVVDSTGDGDVLSWVNEDFDLITYHCGMNFRIGNVDRVDNTLPAFEPVNIGIRSPLKSVNWYNSFGYKDVDATNVLNLSKVQSDLRIDTWKIMQDIKSHPGYEQLFLLDTASQIGTRASRILNARYKLKFDDSMSFMQFDDSVGVSGGWCKLSYQGKSVSADKRPIWQIPYRSLIPKKCKNLLVAGRCFSFELELLEDAREIGTCIVTGQAAGTAAALASIQNCDTSSVDIKSLQSALKKQNVRLS